MTRRSTFLLLAVGLLVQGCTIQKRSVTPGWHVERAGRVLAITPPSSPEVVVRDDKEASERLVAVHPIPEVSPLPLKALMAYAPSISIASELQKSSLAERKMGSDFRSSHEVVSVERREPDQAPTDDENSVLMRTFMGLLALTLDVASVPVISLGFWYGSWALAMFIALGAGLLFLSWFAWLAAIPKFRARIRKTNNGEVEKRGGKRSNKSAKKSRGGSRTCLWLSLSRPQPFSSFLFSCRPLREGAAAWQIKSKGLNASDLGTKSSQDPPKRVRKAIKSSMPTTPSPVRSWLHSARHNCKTSDHTAPSWHKQEKSQEPSSVDAPGE